MGKMKRLKIHLKRLKKETGEKSAEQGNQHVETSRAPETAALASTSREADKPAEEPRDLMRAGLWAMAHKLACERSQDMMADYSRHLSGGRDADVFQTTEAAQAVVDRLMKDRQAKQWSVSLHGKDISVREQAEKLAKFLLFTDGIVKQALAEQPLAALAWTAVSVVLPLVENCSTNHASMLDGFDKIGHIQLYWKLCEEQYVDLQHHPDADGFIDALADLYASVIEYQARVVCHLSKAQLKRAWDKATGSTDWVGLFRALETQSQNCQTYMDAAQKLTIQNMWKEQLRDIQEARTILDEVRHLMKSQAALLESHRDDDKATELLRDLVSSYESDMNANPEIVPDTCKWFLGDEKFQTWRSSRIPGLLWLSAGPGSGKSVLSRHLVQKNLLSNRVTTSTVCYFFFKDGIRGRSNAANALAAILHQMFADEHTGHLVRYAYKAHKEQGKALAENFHALWSIFETCVRHLDPAVELVCLLDALDECSEKSREDLLQNLSGFYQETERGPRAKFLTTSRPYDYDTTLFQSLSQTEGYGHVDADSHIDVISKEIDTVIDAKLRDILGMDNPEEYRGLTDHLKSTKSRTYLWVHLTLEAIRQDITEFRSDPNNTAVLAKLPLDLDEQYEQLLSKSPVGLASQKSLEIFLHILLAAAVPLTLEDANTALTIARKGDPGFSLLDAMLEKRKKPVFFEKDLNKFCGHFVRVYDSKLYFIHQTAREFLIAGDGDDDSNNRNNKRWKGRLKKQDSEKMLSLVCLRHLQLVLDPRAESPVKNPNEIDFFVYASKYWPDHVRALDREAVGDDILRPARELCRINWYINYQWWFLYRDHTSFAKIQVDEIDFDDKTSLDLFLAVYLKLDLLFEYILKEQDDHLDDCLDSHNDEELEELGTTPVDQSEVILLHWLKDIVRSPLQTWFTCRKDRETDNVLKYVFSGGYAWSMEDRDEFILGPLMEVGMSDSVFGAVLGCAEVSSSGLTEVIKRLGEKFPIAYLVECVAKNRLHSAELLLVLLEIYGDAVCITDESVYSVLINYHLGYDDVIDGKREGFLKALLTEHSNQFHVTQKVVERAAAEMRSSRVLEIILTTCKNIKVSDDLIRNVFSRTIPSYPSMIQILLSTRENEVPLTEENLASAAANKYKGYKLLLDLFLSERGRSIIATPFLADTVNVNPDASMIAYILPLLWWCSRRDDPIAVSVIRAAESLTPQVCVWVLTEMSLDDEMTKKAIQRFSTLNLEKSSETAWLPDNSTFPGGYPRVLKMRGTPYPPGLVQWVEETGF